MLQFIYGTPFAFMYNTPFDLLKRNKPSV